jgi:nitrite reductase/ring-hydroxylating ferredoxin subunit
MIRICDVISLPPGESLRVQAPAGSADAIAVFNVEGEFLAIDDTCTHQDASLADGYLDGDMVECPLHASCFDLRTGLPTGPPAKTGVRTHQTAVRDGAVWLVPSVIDAAAAELAPDASSSRIA